jgi:hypothetical protein
MKKLLLAIPLVILITVLTSAQDLNKIVFGPLVSDSAGVLTVHNGDDIEIEMWIRTDPSNPTPVFGVAHGLMSEDAIIASRNGVEIDPYYDMPNWEMVWVDGPFIHNPADSYPIPSGYTCEMQVAVCAIFTWCTDFDTQGEWDYYGAFLVTCNMDVPIEETYHPFSIGWYPHSGQGTRWSFEAPPGGSVVPEQSYCGLYFEPETSIDHNESLPQEFFLFQNHPNPFNATTTIRYSLPQKREVTFEIYNILGRKIETLVSGIQPAGWHSVAWDAENQPSGIYFYRIDTGAHMESKNCLLLK